MRRKNRLANKYIDTISVMQVIGNVLKNPSLLDLDDQYIITEEDFVEDFHKIVFGSIQKIYELGAKKITLESISDFLSTRPKYESIYKLNKGDEYLLKAIENAQDTAFNYYYNRMKKMTLLRAYDNFGLNVSFLYDIDNILDTKKRQLQEEWLDNTPLEKIADIIDEKIDKIRIECLANGDFETTQAGEGISELINELIETPEIGLPLYGNFINSIHRGARLKKFYLRSAPTGIGKTRTMIADACFMSCGRLYDETYGWIKSGSNEPTLYITTEQDLKEVQTLMLAFLSGVDEANILDGLYAPGEEARVREAARIIKEAPLYVAELPDFSLEDIENLIKKNIREHDVSYVFHDYIHTSMKILEEITRKSGGVRLREDNILFMLSIKLKDLCNKYGIFLMSGTQLSAEWKDSKSPDQNLLRGAKAIADKVDFGSILLPVTDQDKESLQPILESGIFEVPDLKLSVYKNRRGAYKGIFLWCSSNLGTCRVNPLFVTTYDYSLQAVKNLQINVEKKKAEI